MTLIDRGGCFRVMPVRFFAALLACLALCLALPAAAEVAVPALAARVTDLTGTLDGGARQKLEGELAAIEKRTGSQLAVLLVPTTQPEAIEQYAMRVVEAWKLGRKGTDNGVLLLVARNDRKLRIEVGYGLEGVIPDAIARRVIAETIAPRFQQGDFAGGIEAGVARIGKLLDGEPMPGTPHDYGGDSLSGALDNLPLLVIVAFVIGKVLRWILGPLLGGLATGGIVGGATWLLVGSLGIAIGAALVAFIIVLVMMSRATGYSSGAGRGGHYRGGGFGGGGGGFSGGGGSFGGGGASGSW